MSDAFRWLGIDGGIGLRLVGFSIRRTVRVGTHRQQERHQAMIGITPVQPIERRSYFDDCKHDFLIAYSS